MNNIFPYVMNREKTDENLISGIGCSPDTVLSEFTFVKKQFKKEVKILEDIGFFLALFSNMTPVVILAIGVMRVDWQCCIRKKLFLMLQIQRISCVRSK